MKTLLRSALSFALVFGLSAAVAADTTIEKEPDVGPWWNPLDAGSGTYVYASDFLAPGGADVTPTKLGTWLLVQGGGTGSTVRFEIWGTADAGGPNPFDVIATTGSIGPFSNDGVLTFYSAPVSGSPGSLTPGERYWFAATVVGEKDGNSYQMGGHTQNSKYQDNGTFWYSNDPSGINFDGKNLTPQIAFSVTLGAGQQGSAYYLRSTVGAPWGQSTNEEAMTKVYGNAWVDARYETVDIGALFSPETEFIYMEGGDNNAEEMAKFIAAHMSQMEKWVAQGGCLVITSAPNEGGDIDLGFGMTLHYPSFWGDTLTVVDPSHPVANGPFLPAGTSYTGSSNSHAILTGPAATVAIDEFGNTTIAELAFGEGGVIFGGLTTDNFWQPQPNAANFRANLIVHACNITGDDCYPDCDESGVLNLFDFLCFTNAFNSGNPYADCDNSGALNLFDFLCFTNAFNAGC